VSAVGLAFEPGQQLLVTGGASGIGRAAERLAAAAGLHVWTPSTGGPGRPIWSTTPGRPARATCLSTSVCGRAPGASTL
jgi:hypothetical protein